MESEEEGGGGVKGKVRAALDNHWLELFVLVLVLVDVGLVTVEAGIDHNLFCIGGKVVPYGSPAGEHMDLSHGHEHGGDHGHGHALLSASEGWTNFLSVSPAGQNLLTDSAADRHSVTRRKGRRVRPVADSSFNVVDLQELRHPVDNETHEHPADDGREPKKFETHLHEPAPGAHGEEHAHHEGEHPLPRVLVCESKDSHRVHHIMHTCHFWSIAILLFFAVELLLKLWAFPGFLDDPFHRLDMFVVFSSLLIDTLVIWYIQTLKEEGTEDAAHKQQQADLISGLLLITRFWRVVRIAHGLYEFQEKKHEIDETSPHAESHTWHSPESVHRGPGVASANA